MLAKLQNALPTWRFGAQGNRNCRKPDLSTAMAAVHRSGAIGPNGAKTR